jgi:hypothetical protein
MNECCDENNNKKNNDNNDNYIMKFYIIKRIFLFVDEWLFYFSLYKLYKNKWNGVFYIVAIYGLSCLLTSYKNINKIEQKIINVQQQIWLLF